jgi:hypothetical protein
MLLAAELKMRVREKGLVAYIYICREGAGSSQSVVSEGLPSVLAIMRFPYAIVCVSLLHCRLRFRYENSLLFAA